MDFCDIRKGWRLSLLVIENWGWTYHPANEHAEIERNQIEMGVGNGA